MAICKRFVQKISSSSQVEKEVAAYDEVSDIVGFVSLDIPTDDVS